MQRPKKTPTMGSFLDKPKTEKETHLADGLDLRAGVSAMQGWRVDMEVSNYSFKNVHLVGPTYMFWYIFFTSTWSVASC